jgi:hypothetical protein
MSWIARACLAIAFLTSGCASAAAPAGPLQPLMVGAEQHFAVDWQPVQSDRPVVVRGYLTNTSPYTFDRIRLLVEALGPEGQIAGQRVVWAPGLLGGSGRTYFEVPMGPAHAYRVRVFSYDRVEFDGRRRGVF